MTVRSLDREEIGWHNITVLAMEMSTSYTHRVFLVSECASVSLQGDMNTRNSRILISFNKDYFSHKFVRGSNVTHWPGGSV